MPPAALKLPCIYSVSIFHLFYVYKFLKRSSQYLSGSNVPYTFSLVTKIVRVHVHIPLFFAKYYYKNNQKKLNGNLPVQR